MQDNKGSAIASDTREVTITWMEHAVYEATIEVPADLADGDYGDIHEWIDEQGFGMPDGECREVTLQEIIDVDPAREV